MAFSALSICLPDLCVARHFASLPLGLTVVVSPTLYEEKRKKMASLRYLLGGIRRSSNMPAANPAEKPGNQQPGRKTRADDMWRDNTPPITGG